MNWGSRPFIVGFFCFCFFWCLCTLPHSSCYFMEPTAGISLLRFARGTDSTSLWIQGLTFTSELIYGQEHLQCFGSRGNRGAQRHHPGLFFRSPWVKWHHNVLDNCASFLTFLALIGVSDVCFLFFLSRLMSCLTLWWWILGLLLLNYSLECAFLL